MPTTDSPKTPTDRTPPPTSEPSSNPRTEQQSLQAKFQNIVFTIIILVTLYVARGFLLPVFAALLLSYALIPFVRFFVSIRIPRTLAALVVTGTFTAVVIFALFAVSGPAMEWLEKAPQSFKNLEHVAEMIQEPVKSMTAASEQFNQITQGENGKKPIVVQLADSTVFDVLLSQTPIVLGGTLSTVILLFFILAFGHVLLKRVVEISPRLKDKKRAVDMARQVESSVSRYLVTVTFINVILGSCIGLSLYLLGFENPVLWGTIATLLNFIPYLGSILGVFLLALASMSIHQNIEDALIYPAVYFLFTLIEGNFVTPLVLGQSFTINPIFIILVLLFLGWLWGVPGAIMAVPILVALKAAATQAKDGHSLATLLSK